MRTHLLQDGTDDPSRAEAQMREPYSHSPMRKMSRRKTSPATNAERRGSSPGSVKPRKVKRRRIRFMPT